MRLLPGCLLGGLLAFGANAQQRPEVVEYDLTITEAVRQPAGEPVRQLLVNGTSPGPVLRFKEGDRVKLIVRNGLTSEDTSIHWHGLLLPNAMDGVPYLTTPTIKPGAKHVFEFTLRQSGTYWYHSHTGLQEQRGVQGAIVIEPKQKRKDLEYDREHVVVLSDWTDEDPNDVMRNLMRGNEWYSVKKGTMVSWLGAYRAGAFWDYLDREKVRMPPMDISDIAYDAFLANGVRQLPLAAKPGERVLLRFINAGASTYFYLTSAAGPLTIVATDGPPVEPVAVPRLLIAMAETYDVIVTMPKEEATVEVRATAQDNSSHATIRLGTGPLLRASNPPRADLYRMDSMIEFGLASIDHAAGRKDARNARPVAPYALLRAPQSTKIDTTNRTVRKLTMRLTGDMRRYLWGFDNKTLSEDSTVRVRKGEVLQIELINDTMMHHPLHLHGHFFRVLCGQGDRTPLKHTVDVPPMGKRIIEWVADEEGGDWFFHCHLLYHMDAGMARVFSYSQDPEHQPNLDPKLVDPVFVFGRVSVQNHMTMGRIMAMQGRNDYFARWDVSLGNHHAEDDTEVDVGWSRYLDPNWSAEVGFRYADVPGAESRGFAGVRYRLPYLVMTGVALDTEGDFRFTAEKDFQLTDRAALFAEYEYDTNTYTEWSLGARWMVNQSFSLSTAYHSDHGFGVGLTYRF